MRGNTLKNKRFQTFFIAIVAPLLGISLLAGCSSSSDESGDGSDVTELTIYSGRSETFIAPFFAEFEAETGIKVNVRYGDSAELAAQILEEGENSPADLFLSQDAGALGAVAEAGLFADLDGSIISSVPSQYASADSKWVGVTGRARVFAYHPDRVTQLPTSYRDMTDPIYKNRFGIAPTNSSFQAFVTALRLANGDAATEKWLRDLIANGAKYYEKNAMIVEAIENGEIDLGLVNHYYVFEVAKALGREIAVKDGFFADGDLGNMINVSGAGILASSVKQSAATDLIAYLLRSSTQEKFVADTKEYALLEGLPGPTGLPALSEIAAPSVDLNALRDLKATQDLLIKAGLL